jgi:hypothetical protein
MRWFLRQLAWLPVYWVMFVPAPSASAMRCMR